MSAWGDFLKARKRLINEFIAERKTCTEIAQILSCEPGQIWLISDMSSDTKIPVPDDVRKAVNRRRTRGRIS